MIKRREVKNMSHIFLFLIILSNLSLILSQECGKRAFGIGLSIGSEYSVKGQWPWLAPLFEKNDTARDNFFCSSNIISNRFLLSGENLQNNLKFSEINLIFFLYQLLIARNKKVQK